MTDHGKFRPLEEVATHSRSSASPEAMEPDAQYILLEHIVSGTGEVEPSTVAMHKIGSNKARYEASDVLYGKLRPNLRKVCVATEPGYCSTDILPLRPRDKFSSYYLAAVLRSGTFTAQVMRLVVGANLPRIGLRDPMKIEVPWPEAQERSSLNEMARQAVALREDIAGLTTAVTGLEN